MAVPAGRQTGIGAGRGLVRLRYFVVSRAIYWKVTLTV